MTHLFYDDHMELVALEADRIHHRPTDGGHALLAQPAKAQKGLYRFGPTTLLVSGWRGIKLAEQSSLPGSGLNSTC
jgi:hypothetical protein